MRISNDSEYLEQVFGTEWTLHKHFKNEPVCDLLVHMRSFSSPSTK